jgi:glycerophosphoryl diester phosphodiesterase
MMILSHRGVHNNAPENTLEAFQEAVAIGVDGIETDVRLSAEGIPILYHDRVAPNGREVCSLGREELEALVEHTVPTLEGAVREFDHVLWNLEIKVPAAVLPTIEVVKRYLSCRQFLITSFWHPVVAEISRGMVVDCGLLVAHRPLDTVEIGRWFPPHIRNKTIVWDYEVLDAPLLEQTTAQGIRNLVYGAMTPEEHNRLMVWGVDGVITDHPKYVTFRR